MKRLFVNAATIALVALSSVSCIGKLLKTDELITDDKLPKGVLPSAEMTFGSAPEEKYAAHAARFSVNADENFPYQSVELFADGTFLFAKSYVRSYEDDMYLAGDYTVTEANLYTLENFGTLKIEGNEEGYNLIFDNTNGNRISTVYASKDPVITGDATKSLCRKWTVDTTEDWMYLGSKLLINTKYYGGDEPRIEGIVGVLEEQMEEAVDLMCKEVWFSPYGTYYCTCNNGTTRVSTWEWSDEQQGILYYDWQYGEQEEGYVTVRFAGNQMRMYEDYTFDISEYLEEEGDAEESQAYVDILQKLTGNVQLRYLIVNTMTAAK